MKRQNVRTLSLIVVTFTYLLLGAAIFDALESESEGKEERRLRDMADKLRQKYNISSEDFDRIAQLGILMKPYKAGTQWKFAGAFYFATTVITTIGYGHSTPKTVEGKVFCMCYALPGIPLCLVMFQSIGERMNTIITWVLKQMKKIMTCRKQSVSQTNLMVFSFTTGSTVLTLGAAVFSRYEDWSFLDSFYYCFITLTTIGFGDFVALQRNDSLAKRPDYVAFSLIFILFGLSVVSSMMNLLVLRFMTMNTEDEQRDQLEAAVHAQELQKLRGNTDWSDRHLYSPEMEQVQNSGTSDKEVNVNTTNEVNVPNTSSRVGSLLSSLVTYNSEHNAADCRGFVNRIESVSPDDQKEERGSRLTMCKLFDFLKRPRGRRFVNNEELRTSACNRAPEPSLIVSCQSEVISLSQEPISVVSTIALNDNSRPACLERRPGFTCQFDKSPPAVGVDSYVPQIPLVYDSPIFVQRQQTTASCHSPYSVNRLLAQHQVSQQCECAESCVPILKCPVVVWNTFSLADNIMEEVSDDNCACEHYELTQNCSAYPEESHSLVVPEVCVPTSQRKCINENYSTRSNSTASTGNASTFDGNSMIDEDFTDSCSLAASVKKRASI